MTPRCLEGYQLVQIIWLTIVTILTYNTENFVKFGYIYIYKAAASVCPSVCLCSGFRKNVQTDFHETGHDSWGSYVDLNGKNYGKCRPLMCKSSENSAKLPISRKSCGWETARGPAATALAARATRAARWPCRQRAGEFHESNVYELIVNCATVYTTSGLPRQGPVTSRACGARFYERRRREE